MQSCERKPVVVGVLRKTLRILDAIQASPSGLSLEQVSRETKINKSTAYRLLAHLEREAYLNRNGDGHYLIGTKVVQLAAHVNPQRLLCDAARPILRDLLQATNETVNLGVLDANMILYVDVLESSHDFRLVSKVGMRRPVYSTALGKALSAFLPEDELQRLLSSIDFQLFTPHTIGSVGQFRKELRLIRRQGFAVDNEEAVLGARCVACPILNARQEAIGAVSVAGPATRISRDEIPLFAKAVKQAAEEISSCMGYSRERPNSVAVSPPVS